MTSNALFCCFRYFANRHRLWNMSWRLLLQLVLRAGAVRKTPGMPKRTDCAPPRLSLPGHSLWNMRGSCQGRCVINFSTQLLCVKLFSVIKKTNDFQAKLYFSGEALETFLSGVFGMHRMRVGKMKKFVTRWTCTFFPPSLFSTFPFTSQRNT